MIGRPILAAVATRPNLAIWVNASRRVGVVLGLLVEYAWIVPFEAASNVATMVNALLRIIAILN